MANFWLFFILCTIAFKQGGNNHWYVRKLPKSLHPTKQLEKCSSYVDLRWPPGLIFEMAGNEPPWPPPGCDSSCLGTRGCRTGSTSDLWSAWRTRSRWSWDGPPGPAAGSPASGPGTPLGGAGGDVTPVNQSVKGTVSRDFLLLVNSGFWGETDSWKKSEAKNLVTVPLSRSHQGFPDEIIIWNIIFSPFPSFAPQSVPYSTSKLFSNMN